MVSSIRNRSPAGDKTPLMKSIQKSLSFGRGSGLDASSVSPRKLLCGIVTGLVFVGALLIFLSGLKSISLSPSGTRYFDNFITVDGLEFKDGDEPFYVVGFNVDSIMEAAIPSVSPRVNVPGISSGRERIKDLLQQASTSGLNVLRTYVCNISFNSSLHLGMAVFLHIELMVRMLYGIVNKPYSICSRLHAFLQIPRSSSLNTDDLTR